MDGIEFFVGGDFDGVRMFAQRRLGREERFFLLRFPFFEHRFADVFEPAFGDTRAFAGERQRVHRAVQHDTRRPTARRFREPHARVIVARAVRLDHMLVDVGDIHVTAGINRDLSRELQGHARRGFGNPGQIRPVATSIFIDRAKSFTTVSAYLEGGNRDEQMLADRVKRDAVRFSNVSIEERCF